MSKNTKQLGTMAETNKAGSLARTPAGVLKTENTFDKDTAAKAKHNAKRDRLNKIAKIARRRNRN